ncbi:prolyl oligopeptidase family serine peptidase [Pendulispora rubella]|uniref:prolyl oligopeptidase n=1 Tax=Pendulispora rubella TaxID=2741070 RepID=A0ABZ2L6Q6_9BACT
MERSTLVNEWTCIRACLLFIALGSAVACSSESDRPSDDSRDDAGNAYPASRRENVADTYWGVQVPDPYRWLEDASSSEVQSWMSAQDGYARQRLAAIPNRDAWLDRLRPLFRTNADDAPIRRQERYFWNRRLADRNKAIVYWKDGRNGAEKVLFDPNAWSADGSAALGLWTPSPNGKFVAYQVHENNGDDGVMHMFDVENGRETGDVIPGTGYSGDAGWTPDNSGFYYTWMPPIGGEVTAPTRFGFAEIRFHRLGTDPTNDAIVHPATHDPETGLGADLSPDGRWLAAFIFHGASGASEVFIQDRTAAARVWTPITGPSDGQTLFPQGLVQNDGVYLRTNLDAPRFRIVKVDPLHPERANWKEVVPQDPEATIHTFAVLGGHLVVNSMRKATTELTVRRLDGTFVRNIALPDRGSSDILVGAADDDTAYFNFESFTTPEVQFETSIAQGTVREYSRNTAPFDASAYVTDQVTYPSKDGTPVTMFVAHRRDVTPNGHNPTILYGYGGFNQNMTPSFSRSMAAWMASGGVYALPNLRGGGEYGEPWHQAGMLLQKQNVFDDFIAAARWLIDNQWTNANQLAIRGGSNGGLLVGATMTQAPELFDAVICEVPLLDMLRYHRFGLGRLWIPEYGSVDDAQQFNALYAYSPYHRVERREYPALLMLSSDSDDRVDPLHARKFIAEMQWANTSNAPAWLRIERNAGHGGADSVQASLEQAADILQFVSAQFADPR